MTKDNENPVEVSITGTLRITVDDEILKEIFIKMMSGEPISLGGYRLILRNLTSEDVPSGKTLTNVDGILIS